MLRLNVQVSDDLFDEVEKYAKKYRITRSSAVSCLLSYALEQLNFEIIQYQRVHSVKSGGSG